MRIAVVGSGYVGLVSAAGFAERGHAVCCIDRDAARIAAIRRGEAPFHEPGLPDLLCMLRAGGLLAADTGLAAGVRGADVILVAVGTPSGPHGIDLAQVEAVFDALASALAASGERPVVAIRSTVVPGTTRALAARLAARLGDGAPPLAVHPEFLREGTALADFRRPDRIVVGSDSADAHARLAALYADFGCPLLAMRPTEAELVKYASNTLLATLVSFANEYAGLCEALPDADIDTVIDGVQLDRRLAGADGRPAGLAAYLRAGSGFGGSCLPKDLDALRAAAHAAMLPVPLLDAVAAVNRARPARVLDRLAAALGGLAGRHVAVFGLSFKPGSDDLRASPALALVAGLRAAGASVGAHDPLLAGRRLALAGGALAVADTAADAASGADAVLIATAWPGYRTLDWGAVAARLRGALVADARNALRGVALPAGLRYLPVGRAG